MMSNAYVVVNGRCQLRNLAPVLVRPATGHDLRVGERNSGAVPGVLSPRFSSDKERCYFALAK